MCFYVFLCLSICSFVFIWVLTSSSGFLWVPKETIAV